MSYYALLTLPVTILGILPFVYAMIWIEYLKSPIFSSPTHPITFLITPLIVFYFLSRLCERSDIRKKKISRRLRKHFKDTWILYLLVPVSFLIYNEFFDLCSSPQSECIDFYGFIIAGIILISILGNLLYVLFPRKRMPLKRIRPYRFSPIQNKEHLLDAIEHIHFSCYALCKQSFNHYLPNAGNMGVFCHYDDEYTFLTEVRKELTEASDNVDQKYFRLHTPIIISASGDVPETTYTHLYIRKPDPYRHHVGDVDFYLEPGKYRELKKSIQEGTVAIKGARVFDRVDLDMIELYDPDVDALAYISTEKMTQAVRSVIHTDKK